MNPNSSIGAQRWWAPEMEPDRLWKGPEVIIYGLATHPDVCSFSYAYDVANRRWYELNVDSVVQDWDWHASVITKHIVDYRNEHGAPPDFNSIHTTSTGSPTTFGKKPNSQVARGIVGNVHYPSHNQEEASRSLPTTTFDTLQQKCHIDRCIDRCVWKGHSCAFKRIEFEEDLEGIEREIQLREELAKALPPSTSQSGSGDGPSAMEQRFRVLPILAVVHKHADTDEVLGFLLPYGGTSLETLAGGYRYGVGYPDKVAAYPDDDPGKPEDPLPPQVPPAFHLNGTQIRDLVDGVREMNRVGVMHGDINDRNVLLRKKRGGVDDGDAEAELVLVALGTVAPEYVNDAYALGRLLAWTVDHAGWPSEEEKGRVQAMAESLKATKDFACVCEGRGDI